MSSPLTQCDSLAPRAIEQELARKREWRATHRPRHAPRIAIVGAGVVGLSIAAELRALGVTDIEISFDRRPAELASHVAAGLVAPIAVTDDTRGASTELEAFARSYPAWASRLATQRSPIVMLRRVKSYRHAAEDTPWTRCLDGVRPLGPHQRHPSYERVAGIEFLSFVVDTPKWMASATARLRASGVHFVRRHLESPDDVRDVDVVVNATGIWASAFVGDPTMCRRDGHVVYVRRLRGVDDVFMDEARAEDEVARDPLGVNMLYVIPRHRDVVLGGTFLDGGDVLARPHPEPGMQERILELAAALEPRLAGAEVLAYRIAARPQRLAGPRLELDQGTYRTPVMHCYGTGGSGWALAPGLAEMAVEAIADGLWGTNAAPPTRTQGGNLRASLNRPL